MLFTCSEGQIEICVWNDFWLILYPHSRAAAVAFGFLLDRVPTTWHRRYSRQNGNNGINLWYRTRTPVITGYVQFLINWNWHLGKIICTVNKFFQCKVLNSSKALSCLLLAGGTQVVACLSWWEASGSLHRACSLAWSYPQEQSFLTVSLGFLGTSQAPSPSGLPAHTDLIALLSSCSQSACSEMNSPLWFILFWEDQPSLNQSYSGNFKITHVRIIETGHK